MTDEKIAKNLLAVRNRVDSAARRSGRKPAEIRVVVVTKSVGIEALRALPALGVMDVAENRVQSLVHRREQCADLLSLRWHMIGHLQTNKVARLVSAADLIHSVDSVRLAARIDEAAARANRKIPVLVQVSTSGEASKSGFLPDELPRALQEIIALPSLEVRGLMTMAPFSDDSEASRPHFRALAEISRSARDECGTRAIGPELSMGMTQDFEVAIEEGATMVRVGTAIFGSASDDRPPILDFPISTGGARDAGTERA